jgi:phosphoribosylformimino-5-aminoimidazole carboxamide ribotide isomerase
MGAPRLHVIDLDAAASGKPIHNELIKEIVSSVLIPVQVGGGIRSFEIFRTYLNFGVDRVILGTAAVGNLELVREICRYHAESLVVSLDARNGKIAVSGWCEDTPFSAIELAKTLKSLGVRRFVYTDINRDGTLSEPNFTAISELIDTVGLSVIASGGISSINHLKVLKKLKAEGAIVGKALYTNNINLKQALDVVR